MSSPPHHGPRPTSEDGYRLWLRYQPVEDPQLLAAYRLLVGNVELCDAGATVEAIRNELQWGLGGLLGQPAHFVTAQQGSRLIVGTPEHSALLRDPTILDRLSDLGDEGFLIAHCPLGGSTCLLVAANHERGLLYGVYHLLLRLSTETAIAELPIATRPRLRFRMLNHWDNLDGTIERGYAGSSLWDWHKLPDHVDPRLIDYARANASIGINGVALTNVNADALVLSSAYLYKVAKLAEVFRAYGIRVYLTARFTAPIELSGLTTADPLDPSVIAWWQAKADEIYQLIFDFGGFVVKANSEGQPGPQNYGRNHADGANLLARALAPHGGLVIWRAFVYDAAVPIDRAKQANLEFEPLDGAFLPNACVQVKNGPVDFQPREPHHPMFGKMPKTPLFLELQLTQEYLGQGTHLVFLGPMFAEILQTDTHAKGNNSTVARIVDGTLDGHAISGMVGVSNIGNDRNWCGHPFAAANWFAFGRFAWDPDASSEDIAEEWLGLTFSRHEEFVAQASAIMLGSREACVDYMTPLGLHHIMAKDHHFGPGPWVAEGRADWTSVYYHRAAPDGIGFDRSTHGSNAVEQYFAEVAACYGNIERCPEAFLLWFHHVDWDYRLSSGETLWNELCQRYQSGVDFVRRMRTTWRSLEGFVDPGRYEQVTSYLAIQLREACWWRDACTLYFQQFSQRPLPSGCEPPAHSLDHYVQLTHYYVPGIPERRFKR